MKIINVYFDKTDDKSAYYFTVELKENECVDIKHCKNGSCYIYYGVYRREVPDENDFTDWFRYYTPLEEAKALELVNKYYEKNLKGNNMDWEYGKLMLEQEDIESLDNWSDDKEYVYSTMDRKFDYLWWEDEKGIHFIDRLWHDYGWNKELLESFEDKTIRERMKTNELELHFKTFEEVKEWIDKKENKENESS